LTYNWITIIAAFLLVTPILLGFMRGLPGELESMKYRIHSAFHSLQWIASYAIAIWGLRRIMQLQMQQAWQIPQLQWMLQQLRASMLVWAIAIPLGACLVYWLIEIVIYPIQTLLFALVNQLQKWAGLLPKGLSRAFAALLQTPKAFLRTFVFVLLVHLALPFVHVPAFTKMAKDSSVYQWTDNQLITPLFTSSLTKQLPMLQQQASNWVHQLGQEAAKNGPEAGRGFFTWQTRFDSNEQIDDTARDIVRGATTDREKAYRLYQWIGSHVSYDNHKADMIESGNFQTLSFGAIPTFESRRGVCTDYSSLMVAMGRAVGLQVKQEFGTAFLPDGSSGPHAWNLVYLADEKKWIPCDPTWEQAGNFFDNPDFYETHKPDGKQL
jgi:uncharacterized membrane protein required for colicin V production